MIRSKVVWIALSMWLVCGQAGAADFCVTNAEELTAALQTADGNGDDDTVKITMGTVNGHFSYNATEAFNLTVAGGYTQDCRSQSSAWGATRLAGDGEGAVLSISTGNASVVVDISRITVTDGDHNAGKGGGLAIAAPQAQVNLTKNLISHNRASDGGGGIYVKADQVTVEGSVFTGNLASGGSGGGGAYLEAVTATLKSNNFSINQAYGGTGGGGLRLSKHAGNPQSAEQFIINNNVFDFNSVSEGSGGGLLVDSAVALELQSNTFKDNTAFGADGAGIALRTVAESVVVNNVIHHNVAFNELCGQGEGGGIHTDRLLSLFMSVNTIVENRVNVDPRCRNTGTVQGGGVAIMQRDDTDVVTVENPGVYIENNLFWKNVIDAGNGVTIAGQDLYINNDADGNAGAAITTTMIDFNMFDQSERGFSTALAVNLGAGNLDGVDPQFLSETHGVYALKRTSPVVDAGGEGFQGLPEFDHQGNRRAINQNDMGAYELQASRDIMVFPAMAYFGDVQQGEQGELQVYIYNAGASSAGLTINSILINAVTETPFTVVPGDCESTTLGADEGCMFTLNYDPQTAGFHSHTVSVRSDDPNESAYNILLIGHSGLQPLVDINKGTGGGFSSRNGGGGGGGSVSMWLLFLLPWMIVLRKFIRLNLRH